MRGRIQVIEDQERNLYLVHFILECGGYDVFEAADNQSGIDAAVILEPVLIHPDTLLVEVEDYLAERDSWGDNL